MGLSDAEKTLVSEAAGESKEGKYYVASSMVNRAHKQNKTVDQVVNQPHQYSGRTRPDLEEFVARQPKQTISDAKEALQKASQSPAPGVTHYVSNKLYHDSHRPSWVGKMKVRKVVGNHTFMGE